MKKSNKPKNSGKPITRKEAIKKTGVAALTAASILLLETKAHAQTSPGSTPSSPNSPTRNPRG